MLLKILYIILNAITLALIISIGFKTISKTFKDKAKSQKKKRLLLLSLFFWQLYVISIASTGYLQNYDLPPRFAIVLIIPAFIFTALFLYSNRQNIWIINIPSHHLILYQSFRILIESLFVLSVAEGVMHKNVTIEGYNFDMVYAITAPLFAYIVFKQTRHYIKFAKLWNYLGLLVIVSIIFVFISTIFFPGFYGSDIPLMPLEFATYPYVLVPSFLMPSAVFMHILSLIQLNRFKSAEK